MKSQVYQIVIDLSWARHYHPKTKFHTTRGGETLTTLYYMLE